MYKNFRSFLFRLDAESAHNLTLRFIRLSGLIPGLRDIIRQTYQYPGKRVKAFGLEFKNQVGLAAGYDKDGIGWQGLALLGFSHIELGTVTPLPQFGNQRPRIFRLVEEEALLNSMGFPGRGAEFLLNQILNKKRDELILGVNIGKNTATPLVSAVEDYRMLITCFAGVADYLVINISSPNTIGLRRLQARKALDTLLSELVAVRQEQENKLNKKVPLLVKLSPDLDRGALLDAIEVIIKHGIDGVVAANTSLAKGRKTDQGSMRSGGISGGPIKGLSTEIVERINLHTNGSLPIIGVGGIACPSDAQAKLDAGAVLIQVYTGLVFRGPGLVKEILQGLSPRES